MKGREEVKDLDKVMDISWRIVRKISESTYSWDSKVSGKTEIVGVRNSVE